MQFPARCRALAVTLSIAAAMAATAGTAVPAQASYTASPFVGRSLFVDPSSAAAKDAAALADSNPTAAKLVNEIAGQPQADWLGDWNPTSTLAATVAGRVATIRNAGAYPVFVAYNIPKRDCNSYSGGGAASPDAYKSWINALKAGLGTTRAAVVLEPDALGQLTCLSATDQQTRLSLLKYATQKLAEGGTVAVYLDAGHADWVPATTMAERLSKAGVASARGFALNVSNFGTTSDQIAYGSALSPLVGWKRFVIDTSRNGLGPAAGAEAWCNPPGRALGAPPTADTGNKLVDALLWIKHPGESDGTCNGGPPAGQWWRDYAVGLAERN